LQAGRNPILTHYHQQHLTAAHLLINVLGKVHAEGDAVHVLKDVVAAKLLGQTVIDAACVTGAVVPTVGDEDFAGDGGFWGWGVDWGGDRLAGNLG
jgi:hypothetical protein